MYSQQRRAEEKNEIRSIILRASKEIAANDGWQNLTIRKICEKIHYTAPVIYQYFESKDKILIALRTEGIDSMYQKFEEIDKKTDNPEKRLIKYGLAWWNFALNYPELYQVMYNLQGVLCLEAAAQKPTQHNTVIDFYKSAFAAINSKVSKSEKLQLELCDNLIALIHGFIALNMVDKIRSGKEHAEEVYKVALHRFIDSIHVK